MARKPRTLTGRVAQRLREAVLGTTNPTRANELARMRTDLEYVFMLVCAQATRQGLAPTDLDNDQGVDVFSAIFLMVAERDREIIHVTPEWRRVVISARMKVYWPRNNLRPPPTPRRRKTKSSSDDLSLRTSS